MAVTFNKQNAIQTSHQELLAAGFRCLNTNTVIQFYTKEGKRPVYYHTKEEIFFRNPKRMQKQEEVLKIIVAGGRDLTDQSLVDETLDKLLRKRSPENVIIVCGEAPGADTLGKKYAIKRGIKVKSFPADWDGYGRAAGPRRNGEMARYATHCLCFWDQRSKGTANMIKQAKENNLILKVVHYS